MDDAHYGVVEQGGVWVIIGAGLKFGSYEDRESAERAARGLAESAAVGVQLHVQDDDTHELLPPQKFD